MSRMPFFITLIVLFCLSWFFYGAYVEHNIIQEEPVVEVPIEDQLYYDTAFVKSLPNQQVSEHSIDILTDEEECLALNVYFEARGENLAGQYAVSDVVLNRLESKRFPDTVCGVVKQSKMWDGHPIRNQCHFSWYCDGKSDVPRDSDAWERSRQVAVNILFNNKFRGITEGATHYHARYVNPKWNENMSLVGTIGDHIFYRD